MLKSQVGLEDRALTALHDVTFHFFLWHWRPVSVLLELLFTGEANDSYSCFVGVEMFCVA